MKSVWWPACEGWSSDSIVQHWATDHFSVRSDLNLRKGWSNRPCKTIRLREIYTEYQDKISESHPEVCFACLAGSPLLSNKKEFLGLTERTAVMASFLPDATMELILRTVEEMKQAHVKCAADDLADAICLALTACLDQQGKTRTIPEKPESNRDGLLMRMIIPSL